MPNRSAATVFAGLPLVPFPESDAREDAPVPADALADPASAAWLLRMEEPEDFEEAELSAYLERFTRSVDPSSVRALVVGNIANDDFEFQARTVRDRLTALARRMPHLRALFFGEILQEENELSWIIQDDLAPLFAAFPGLTEFAVRGTEGLGLNIGRHDRLRRLTVESAGLPGRVVREIAASDLPALEHLELWLGTKHHGNDTTAEDLTPILSGGALPGLRSLGLRNADGLDAWIPVLAEAPVLAQLDTLDLSLGTLTDEGARVLLDAPGLRRLRRLDLHHHFLSGEMAERVRAEFTAAGVEVDVSEREEPYEAGGRTYYFPAVGE
ncbi:STM4015 family protein [Nocardiopsis aegyptia]|uniref:STM4015 family protein n=1 Tax=Nocardiopsis aegyptia TaxID=220378 RepID=UPI0036712BFA